MLDLLMKKAQLEESTKIRIIQSIITGEVSVAGTAQLLGIGRASIHRWLKRYKEIKSIPRLHSPEVGRPSSIDLISGKKLLNMIKQRTSSNRPVRRGLSL